MYLFNVALSALAVGSVLAASGSTTVHVVTVGNANGSLSYNPNKVVAAVGDMVQFQFMPNNHTVTQSTFDKPCQPIAMNSNVTGIYSGFMPVKATDTKLPTFTVLVNNTTPVWIYCSQGKHCQSGMSMVINENTAANSTRSLENYMTGAKTVTTNLAPMTGSTDGTSGTTTSGSSNSTATNGTAASATARAAGSVLSANGVLSYGALFAIGVAMFV